MSQNGNNTYRTTLKHHIIFWLIYFLFNTFRWGSFFNDYSYSIKTNLFGFPIHMILCYLNIYVLMPYLVFKKRYLIYVLSLLSAIFLMVLLKYNLTYYLVSQNVWPEADEQVKEFTLNYAVAMMIGELYVITFVSAIKMTLDFLREHKRVSSLEKVQLETELRFLKTQVSPHFFFNTLNNIYALSIEKSKKTPIMILKLSEIMRYLLYETRERRQSLEKEILYIQNYIELQRLRYDDSLEVNMFISGDIEDKEIAPILLLPFIENAFKFGANENIGNIEININFKIKEDFLYFTVSNPMPQNPQHLITPKKNKNIGGIGLKNVKKRLELGYKKNDYKLSIKTINDKFVVKLKIRVA